ncbi:hypothetical protein LWM68_25575 [Niabella sp. W65]|nr:hypothetical protein [Niabella sp. W65]MCH7365836.1 hypothetical protein [Niabella sp. W65]ULT41590.1 hypothetical protein KRR40_44500 [Niabella sp. I65]
MSPQIYADGHIKTATDRFFSEFQTAFSLNNYDCKTYVIDYKEASGKEVKQATLLSKNATEGTHSSRHAFFPVNILQRSFWIYSDFDDPAQSAVLTVNSFNLNESYAYKEFSAFSGKSISAAIKMLLSTSAAMAAVILIYPPCCILLFP